MKCVFYSQKKTTTSGAKITVFVHVDNYQTRPRQSS